MKKYNSITGLVLCCCLFAGMQIAQAQLPVRLGLTISPLVSFYGITNPEITGKPGLGFQIGATVDYPIAAYDRIELSSGLLFTRNNGTVRSYLTQAQQNVINSDYTASYLEIPLTIKVKVTEFNYFKFFGRTGVAPSFKISQQKSFAIEGPAQFGPIDIGIPDVNALNFAFLIGGGAEYSVAEHLTAIGGLTYSHGFANVIDNSDDERIKQHYLVLNLGLLF